MTDLVDNQPDVKMYAVFRDGNRVSDSEYDSKMGAQTEYIYWAEIVKRYPDGSKLEIRQVKSNYYNNTTV
jgi:hypothetical protein